VGESSVEVQAHYLREVLGLADHLDQDHLHKFGLRMFFSSDGNDDIARRVEYGQIKAAPLPSYQLDRGRLENRLGQLVAAAGAELVTGQKVTAVELGSGGARHRVRLGGPASERILTADWVVDASGRAGLLKRKLGLAKPVPHRANAAWFRTRRKVDVGTWSDDEAWRSRVPSGERRLSTNHLMGRGYWVWLIPLGSGGTSVGIVADAALHPHEGFNTLEKAMAWLAEREPQCAAAVAGRPEEIQDFRIMHDYAYGARQVYAEDRWCLTGEAGVAIDPLYSSGGDLMAISNGLIVDLVTRDRRGEDIAETVVAHNQVYLVLADIWLVAYQDQYPLMGNPQVMVAKVIWDTIIYWAVPGLLFFHDKLRRLAESPRATISLNRTWQIHIRVQQFFREWHAVEPVEAADVFADPYSLFDILTELHTGMAAGLPDDELEHQLEDNVDLLEQVAGQLFATVADRLRPHAAGPVADQVRRWAADPSVTEPIGRFREHRDTHPVSSEWISLGGNARLAPAEVAA
jgi:flavin-dependent dehydrogenase